jgi:hypothetical protein
MKISKKRKPSRASLVAKVTEMLTGKKAKRRPKPPPHFSIPDAIALANDILSRPPAPGLFIKRPKPRANLVALFALPLHLCPTTNATRGAPGWKLDRMKTAIGNLMIMQNRRSRAPLPGRPQVIARRFSEREPDPHSDWAKMPIDRLVVGANKLGYLRDDKGSEAEIHQVWEPAPHGKGCVIIEVRT